MEASETKKWGVSFCLNHFVNWGSGGASFWSKQRENSIYRSCQYTTCTFQCWPCVEKSRQPISRDIRKLSASRDSSLSNLMSSNIKTRGKVDSSPMRFPPPQHSSDYSVNQVKALKCSSFSQCIFWIQL